MATEAKPTEPASAPAAAAAPVDITKTPEFIAAVAAATAQTQATMLASMQAILAASQGGPSKDTISELTAAIVGMQDPKNLQRRISPAEAEKRQTAFNAMGALIMDMRANGKKAVYEVVGKTYLGERFIEPWTPGPNGQWDQTTITWNGAPNSAMRPINDVATAIFEQYLIYIGGSTKNQAGVVEQPTWVSGGIVMVGTPSETASARGHVKSIAPMEIDDINAKGMGPTVELTSTDHPNADNIPILGTVAQPARRTDAGTIKNAHIAQ